MILATVVWAAGTQEGASAPASGEPVKLVVWCNSVYQQVAEGTKGALFPLARQFEERFNVKIEWVPIAWNQMQD